MREMIHWMWEGSVNEGDDSVDVGGFSGCGRIQ